MNTDATLVANAVIASSGGFGATTTSRNPGLRFFLLSVGFILTNAWVIVLVLREALRPHLFPKGCRKNKLFSGPFVFLKLKPDVSPPLLVQTHSNFNQLVMPVRTNV